VDLTIRRRMDPVPTHLDMKRQEPRTVKNIELAKDRLERQEEVRGIVRMFQIAKGQADH
jgi:hypothetical protein